MCIKKIGLILGSFMLRAFLSFQPVLNTVKSTSQNRGQLVPSDSKRRGKRAKLKKEGKRGIGSQNKGSFAIVPNNLYLLRRNFETCNSYTINFLK